MCEYTYIYIYIYTYVVFLELPEFYDYSVYCAQHEQFSDRKLAGKKNCIRQFCQGYSISIQLNNEDCQSIKCLARTSHFFTVMSFLSRWILMNQYILFYVYETSLMSYLVLCVYIYPFSWVGYFICPYSCKPGILFHLALWIFYHFQDQF